MIIKIVSVKSFIISFFIIASFQTTGFSQTNDITDQKISDLVKNITIEEKVGQMTQLTLGVFYKNGKLQDDLLKEYITTYHIGSILNVPSDYALSIEQWHELLNKIATYSEASRLQIPVLYGIDAIHGATYTQNATLFPHNIGIAATRDPELAYKIAEVTAKEIRASGIRWNFDPVLGVGRQPLWSRFEETFGEDVLLVTHFGNEAIKGYEGDDLKHNTHVASCMKHFIGYSVPASGKDRTPSYIPDVMFNDIFIPPFKKATENGSSTVMVNSSSINGVPVHINKHLLTDLLKNEWGFKGFIVTDWNDINFLYEEHKVAKDSKEATKLAVNAGIDMSMVPENLTFYHDLVELVKEGEVNMKRIDDAVSRILKVKFDLGLFDNPYPEKEAFGNFNLSEYKSLALQSALESLTLLKNDTINNTAVLPLSKNAKVLIAGPGANSLATLHGSWSFTWQGKDDSIFPETTLTIKEAIENKIGRDNVMSVSPVGFQDVTQTDIEQMVKASEKADYIILCLGENSYAESPGSINDLTLSKDQIELAKAAISTKKPVILILTEGRPRIISAIADDIPGILLAYRPGSEGANAIAEVIFGDHNPSGRLPYTYPRESGNIFTYDAPVRNQKYYNPQWAFGFGLSYTTFTFGDIQLNTDTLQGHDTLYVHIDVTNTGNRQGEIAVDLFVKDLVASIVPPMKKLRKFSKIALQPGETKTVPFELTKDDLSFVNAELKTVTEDGAFEIQIGNATKRFTYQGTGN